MNYFVTTLVYINKTNVFNFFLFGMKNVFKFRCSNKKEGLLRKKSQVSMVKMNSYSAQTHKIWLTIQMTTNKRFNYYQIKRPTQIEL